MAELKTTIIAGNLSNGFSSNYLKSNNEIIVKGDLRLKKTPLWVNYNTLSNPAGSITQSQLMDVRESTYMDDRYYFRYNNIDGYTYRTLSLDTPLTLYGKSGNIEFIPIQYIGGMSQQFQERIYLGRGYTSSLGGGTQHTAEGIKRMMGILMPTMTKSISSGVCSFAVPNILNTDMIAHDWAIRPGVFLIMPYGGSSSTKYATVYGNNTEHNIYGYGILYSATSSSDVWLLYYSNASNRVMTAVNRGNINTLFLKNAMILRLH